MAVVRPDSGGMLSEETHPAGWFTDPFDASLIRYWDGQQWTEHVAPAVAPQSEVTPQPVVQPSHSPDELAGLDLPDDPSGKFPKPIILGIVALVVILAGAGAWALTGGGDDNLTATGPAPATTPSVVVTTTAAESPTTSVPPVTSVPPTTADAATTTATTITTTTTAPPECNDVRDPLPPSRFTDLGAVSQEASTAIRWAQSVGLVTLGDGQFRPADSMSRAGLITVLWRYFCQPPPQGSAGFVDVPAGAYFQQAADWAESKRIISVNASGTFNPGDPLSRAQFVTIAWRSVGSPTGSPPAPFTDVTEGDFYSSALDWAFDVGLVSGRSPTSFAPGDPVDRLTAIVLFWRLESIVDPSVM